MASFRKIKGKVLVEVRIKGRYESKVHSTKAAAKIWAHETEHRIRQSKGVLLGKSFAEALSRYAEEETPKKKGARWESIRIRRLREDKIAVIQLSDLQQSDFEDFIERYTQNGLKGSSINRYLSVFSVVLSKARSKKWRWLADNPMSELNWPDESPHRTKVINKDEQEAIITALGFEEDKPIVTIRQRIAVAFLFAIETAMRYGEIWGMVWENINWDECYVHLPETKNGTSRNVPLSIRAIQLLDKIRSASQGPVIGTNPKSSEVIFRKITELLGYNKGFIHFHDTRHTAITLLAPKLHILDLAKMTGHKNLKELMTYYNPTPKSIADKLG